MHAHLPVGRTSAMQGCVIHWMWSFGRKRHERIAWSAVRCSAGPMGLELHKEATVRRDS